ncbi:hypothetical protein [Chelativorans sp. AA-79]|uniref:hypothetical protein n=1 Tax=Chelativorans sp. AA-79 TaxID=3028735 RepID=UPI0023F6AF3A|nr:hypothetical protein [Chelativorans sp. AA-79]WEX08227.1 hypothetical protein PVE73_19405 [Chelativorans sp. AA-79]
MSLTDETERRLEEAEAHIRTAMAKEFCHVMDKTGLPPMAVLRLAAQAVGSIYCEAADAHSGPRACPCGWCPHQPSDIEILGMALVTACRMRRAEDLASTPVAGTA